MSEIIGVAALVAALVGMYLIGRARQREIDRQHDDRYRREVKADQDDLAGVTAREWRERLRKRANRNQ